MNLGLSMNPLAFGIVFSWAVIRSLTKLAKRTFCGSSPVASTTSGTAASSGKSSVGGDEMESSRGSDLALSTSS